MDCHSFNSDFFYGDIVLKPFDEDGNPIKEKQYKILGTSGFMVWLSAFREQYLKSALYPLTAILLIIIFLHILLYYNEKNRLIQITAPILAVVYLIIAAAVALVFLKPDVRSFVLPERVVLDANHFFITVVSLIVGLIVWARLKKEGKTDTFVARSTASLLIIAIISGFLMMIKFDLVYPAVRIAYTLFDMAVILCILLSVLYFIINQFVLIKKE